MNNRSLHLFLLLFIAFVAFTVNNGALEANIMEARNLTTAREMLQNNNWLEPTMNGELRLEKPPLPTWIAAATMHFFGEENLSLLRLPAALAALLMIFFLFKLTTELTEDQLLPFLVAGTAGTSFYIFFMARDISWDIFCHSFMIGAIWLFHKGIKNNGNGWRALAGAGVLMGLSFMSKGPIAFYALLLPYLIARSFSYGWRGVARQKKGLALMVLIALVISFWWPMMIWFSHPKFSAQIAQQESAAWLNRSTRPFYHYWSFPVQSGIWAIIATIALYFPYARPRIKRFGNYTFLALWVVITVILLSLFPEKKERYLLPVLLPLAILTAFYFRYLIHIYELSSSGKADIVIIRMNTLLMALISFAIPLAVVFAIKGEGKPGISLLILIFILFWGLATFLIGAFLKKNPLWLWVGMVGMVLSVCLTLLPIVPKLAMTNPDYHSYKELRHRDDLKDVPFYFNGEIPGKFIEVVWKSGHEVKAWNPLAQPQLPASLPIIFLSNEPPSTVLPAEIQSNHHIEVIGHFDGNMGKTGGNIVLSNYVTIIW
ncbi:MAG TPA: glycosyltransferase family 39 protein [Prolixibacteraceae bacterium]|nr:glycosyltransferase family 39 protein [Prolixibacteraceae bacterium]